MKAYDHYVQALDALKRAPDQDLENEFIQGGVVSKFQLQFELGWKLFKALLAYEGDATAATGSPRDIIKAAYRYYDFMDEDVWLQMLRSRNEAAHIYDGTVAARLTRAVVDIYLPEFVHVQEGVEARYGELLHE